jgi:hypothetical protein
MSSRGSPIRALSLDIGLASAVDPTEGTDPEQVPPLVLADLPVDPSGLGEPYLVLVPSTRSAEPPAVLVSGGNAGR